MLRIFKGKDKNEMNQGQALKIELVQKEQWQELLDSSVDESVFIFKHSTRCGISSVILNRFDKQMREKNQFYYLLNILANRELSNWIADELNIRHESPQLIVIKGAKVVAYDSHYRLLEINKSILN